MPQTGIFIIVLTWLLQLCFSLPAWTGGKIFDEYFFFFYSPFLNISFSLIFIFSLGLILFNKSKQMFYYFLTTLSLVVLCVFNVNLIQPWQLVNLFLLGCFVFKQEQLILIIISGLFFWSGINKINPWFQSEIFSWFFSPLINHKLQNLYWLIPVVEITSAIFLLFPKTRKNAAIVCIFKHLFVVILLSPLFHNWNYVVIPWNIGLAALLFVLYVKPTISKTFQSSIKPLKYTCILFFWITPAFWYIGIWPYNLSFHLYSGYHSTTYLYTNKGYKIEIEQYHIENYGLPLYINDNNLLRIKNRIDKRHTNISVTHVYKQPFITDKKLKKF